MMMTYDDVRRAIDLLAENNGLSVSELMRQVRLASVNRSHEDICLPASDVVWIS